MSDAMDLLQGRVAEAVARLDKLQGENKRLMAENDELKGQMAELRSELESLRLSHNDRTSAVRTRLASMLSRVEELEKIGL